MSALDASTADEVARAVRSCPDVVGLGHRVATYLPGRRVEGVRRRDSRVEVHVVARGSQSLPAVAADVRAAVERIVDGPVDVVIDDLLVEGNGSGAGP